MQNVLSVLEWLSKYGLIDIVFGVGIFTFLFKIFKSKKTNDIEGVDIIPFIDKSSCLFILTVKNQSSEPLYLYQAYLKAGYYSDKICMRSFKVFMATLIFRTWKVSEVAKSINQAKTTKGQYILQLPNSNTDYSPTLFVEPRKSGHYQLNLNQEISNSIENPNEVFNYKQFGTLTISFVKGTKTSILEVPL